MPFPFMAVAMGAQALGSALSARTQAKQNRDQLRQQADQFAKQQQLQREQMAQGNTLQRDQMGQSDRQFGANFNTNRVGQMDQRAQQAAALQRQINLNPLADRAAYMLAQRAGAMPAAFQPRDYTQGGIPGRGQATGGLADVLNAQRTAAGNYKAGMGGMDPAALIAARNRLQFQGDMPGMYGAQTPPPSDGGMSGGTGGGMGGGGGRTAEEEMMMARFTPYLLF
jgi:hypothetical protein